MPIKRIKSNENKVLLQKALRERLDTLTESLQEAEIGNKGIDLIKEMKELYAILDHVFTEDKARKDQPTNIKFTWILPQ